MSGNKFEDQMYELRLDYGMSEPLFERLLQMAKTAHRCLENWTDADAAIQRVRDLHLPYPSGWCPACNHDTYPCPTIRALDGEQE